MGPKTLGVGVHSETALSRNIVRECRDQHQCKTGKYPTSESVSKLYVRNNTVHYKYPLKLNSDMEVTNYIIVCRGEQRNTTVTYLRKFISRLYMFQAQVLIVRRPKLYYTASGITTPIGGCPVQRLREDWITCASDGHLHVR